MTKTYSITDSQALPSVTELYSFLQKPLPGIMFGHQDTLSYGIGWKYKNDTDTSDVYKVCNDYPALCGWDLGHLETGSETNIDNVPFSEMRHNICRAYEMGAISTISWHPTNPVTGGNTWDVSARVVEQILPGGAYADKFENWLNTIADYLLSLVDSKGNLIPIIFRPYHEHTGSWFWWGNDHCTQEEYITLWKYTVTFLRDTKQVHNLLYCYSSDKVENTEEYLYKYPGDQWVDILGLDCYDFPHAGVHYPTALPKNLQILQEVGIQKQKPYALTETGNLCVQHQTWWTDMLLQYADNYGIKWFLVWINIEEKQYYGPYPQQMSANNFVEFYKNPKTIFVSDLKIL
jgi:mannan endo-1,4-beta-mannosidase